MNRHTYETLEYPLVLEWLAECAASTLGAERLLALEPLTDLEALAREEERVSEVLRLFEQNTDPPLGGLRDCRESWENLKPEGALLEPEALIHVADLCEVARRVDRFFTGRESAAPRLCKIAEGVTPLPELEDRIRECLTPSGKVTDRASPRIAELRGAIARQEQRIQGFLDSMVASFKDDLQDTFYTQRNGRYVIPVKCGAKGRVPGIVHDVSGSGETFFVEPLEMVEQTNELTALRAELREEIRRVLAELSALARRDLPFHLENTERLGELDAVTARARFGWNHGWTLPPREDGAPLKLVQAHHPILRVNLGEKSIPLNLELNAADRSIVISGPNAGGKTTALKTIGLLTLMRQAAIPIPAHVDTRLPARQSVLADVGDDQSILEGVSTFSSHIRRLTRIVDGADRGTLVLLDELGTATDPTEGGALATAILEALEERGATVTVTSHLTALKQWAHQRPTARNCSFQLEESTRRPTFRLKMDLPGVSEALTVAEQQGMDAAVIARARELLPQGAAELSELLADLEARRNELDKRLKEVDHLRGQSAKEKQKWEKQLERMRARENELDREFTAEREKWLRGQRADIEKRIATLQNKRELLDAQKDIRRMQEEERQRAERLKRVANLPPTELERLQPGARVRVKEFNDDGEILSVDLERNRASVALRNINVEVALDQLRLLAEREEDRAPTGFGGIRVNLQREQVDAEIDVHGMHIEPALEELEQYLDRALLQNRPHVRVVHGHGTGRLRKAIHERLREHPQVRRYRFGNDGEGGGAVTIVEFR